ncbi:TadE/TadG family type IV pilus assembly protein [Micromonospora sp. 4G57]|uniref:TadE/TadG family type IV pilus assembly protein n=1 Tax=Micromonospora sicca TaxID=2202420 RepID=A0ABU5JMY1_9ACTN|nr:MULTISPECIES: TadE/TadG family type IV pilus assembly protein [unclassified Micromonospora]MDZ5447308.1 TadE/TadG family type IV pilus assembly protein [Micromonospora sp. 4G57]MDZ5493987.1 TadE/TadG family type IV pilus assembly protein [Micromonospora sp. 4G53]
MVDRPERGSVSIEVAVLAPAFIALMVLAGVAGRTAVADEAVESAAHDAARAASIARDARTGRAAAVEAARRQLDWRSLNCSGEPALSFSGSVGRTRTTFERAYRSAPGVPATVTVTVSCTVSFADLRAPGLPGVPGGKAVAATFTSPLDTYRSRR